MFLYIVHFLSKDATSLTPFPSQHGALVAKREKFQLDVNTEY